MCTQVDTPSEVHQGRSTPCGLPLEKNSASLLSNSGSRIPRRCEWLWFFRIGVEIPWSCFRFAVFANRTTFGYGLIGC